MINNLLKKGLFFLILFIGFFAQAQMHDPVQWNTEVKQVSEDEYQLIMNAFIQDQWHLYSQSQPEGAVNATVF